MHSIADNLFEGDKKMAAVLCLLFSLNLIVLGAFIGAGINRVSMGEETQTSSFVDFYEIPDREPGYYTPNVIEMLSSGNAIDGLFSDSNDYKLLQRSTYQLPSGSKISIYFRNDEGKILHESFCSVTVISDDYALTSGHCFKKSEEKGVEKVEIRVVNSKGEANSPEIKLEKNYLDEGLDFALLELGNNIKGIDDPVDLSSTQERMSPVSFKGSTTGIGQGRVLNAPNYINGKVDKNWSNIFGGKRKESIVTDVYIRPGDSGGVAYNSEGKIIGIAESYLSDGRANFVPIMRIISRMNNDGYYI